MSLHGASRCLSCCWRLIAEPALPASRLHHRQHAVVTNLHRRVGKENHSAVLASADPILAHPAADPEIYRTCDAADVVTNLAHRVLRPAIIAKFVVAVDTSEALEAIATPRFAAVPTHIFLIIVVNSLATFTKKGAIVTEHSIIRVSDAVFTQ